MKGGGHSYFGNSNAADSLLVWTRALDPDLFFALRGSGGGTFATATRLTLATHPLPWTIGAVIFSVTAQTDGAWAALVERVLGFYAEALFNPTWGEQIRFHPRRRLSITMVFHGLDRDAAAATWRPFFAWIEQQAGACRLDGEPVILVAPRRRFRDSAFLTSVPGVVLADDRPGAPAANVFWASNLGEAGQVLHACESMWLPAMLLAAGGRRAGGAGSLRRDGDEP